MNIIRQTPYLKGGVLNGEKNIADVSNVVNVEGENSKFVRSVDDSSVSIVPLYDKRQNTRDFKSRQGIIKQYRIGIAGMQGARKPNRSLLAENINEMSFCVMTNSYYDTGTRKTISCPENEYKIMERFLIADYDFDSWEDRETVITPNFEINENGKIRKCVALTMCIGVIVTDGSTDTFIQRMCKTGMYRLADEYETRFIAEMATNF